VDQRELLRKEDLHRKEEGVKIKRRLLITQGARGKIGERKKGKRTMGGLRKRGCWKKKTKNWAKDITKRALKGARHQKETKEEGKVYNLE